MNLSHLSSREGQWKQGLSCSFPHQAQVLQPFGKHWANNADPGSSEIPLIPPLADGKCD